MERCSSSSGTAAGVRIREVVVASMSGSEVRFHARVEVGERVSECVVRWGSSRLPDRLVYPGVDLALACATRAIADVPEAKVRFDDLTRSLWASARLAGLEYEYKRDVVHLDELYPVLVEELELHRWWSVEEPAPRG
jgi:hypothetical protein